MSSREYHKEWYKRNRQAELEKAKANRLANPEARKSWLKDNGSKPKVRFDKAKGSAKSRKKNWSLTFEEYARVIAHPCFYCGTDNSTSTGSGLDRLDNAKGYELSNVVSCCSSCNSGRNHNFTPEEWKIGITAILAFRKQVQS